MSNRYDPGDLEPLSAPEPRTLPSEHDRSRRSLLGRIRTRWNDRPGRTRAEMPGLADLAAGRAVMAAMTGPR